MNTLGSGLENFVTGGAVTALVFAALGLLTAVVPVFIALAARRGTLVVWAIIYVALAFSGVVAALFAWSQSDAIAGLVSLYALSSFSTLAWLLALALAIAAALDRLAEKRQARLPAAIAEATVKAWAAMQPPPEPEPQEGPYPYAERAATQMQYAIGEADEIEDGWRR